MLPPENGYVPLGTHSLRIDADSIFFVARGVVIADDMRWLLDTFDRIMDEHGQLFVFYDASKCTGLDAGARHVAAVERPVRREADLQVAFGISAPIRILLNMLIRAQTLLSNRTVRFIVFDSEAKARAFFDSERQKLRAQSRVNLP